MDLRAKLQYIGDLKEFQAEYPLEQEVTTIGRKDGSDIVLFPQSNPWFSTNLKNGPTRLAVSRKHAQIVREGGKFYIEDLGSLVGTYVNGKKIGECPLKEIYSKLYRHGGSDSSLDDPIREKNRGKIKLENGDKIGLGEEIFSEKDRYQFVFRTS